VKILTFLLPALFSFNALALNLDMTLKAHQKTLLKSTSKKLFKQYYLETSGRFDIKLIDEENDLEYGQDVPIEITNSSEVKIEVQKKYKTVRYIDHKEDIDKIVPADISKTMTKKVKSIVIKKEVMLALYKESMEHEGITALSGLNISTEGLNLKTSFEFTDFVCKKGDEGLICDQDMSISITAEGN
jgi:hypothetical protein